MVDKNIQMHDYDNINGFNRQFPITKTELVFDKEGKNVESVLSDFKTGVNGILNDVLLEVDKKLSERPLILGKEYGVQSGDDVTSVLQMLCDRAYTEKRSIIIPEGTWYVSSTINTTATTEIEGYSMSKSHLCFTGSGPLFKTTGGGFFRIRKMSIFGDVEGENARNRPNTTCFESELPIQATEVFFKYWDIIVDWKGGFYYKFFNCRMFNFRVGFNNINSNNVNIIACRVVAFHTFLRTRGGNGPLNCTHTSFERWVHRVFQATSGASPQLNVSHCYFENYPQITPPASIGDSYSETYVISNFKTVNLRDNLIGTRGVRRFLYSGYPMESLVSSGNYIIYQSGMSELEYMFFVSGVIRRGLFMDSGMDILTNAQGLYTTRYFTPNQQFGNSGDGSLLNDPFTNTVR